MYKTTKIFVLGLLVFALCAMLCTPCARAASITLAWDTSENATGYKLYYGTTSKTYTTTIDVHNVLTYTIADLAGISAPANVRLAIATATKPAAVLIAWDSVIGATGYTIKYGTVSGTYTTTITTGNVGQYLLPGLKNNTTYYLTVTATGTGTTTYYFAATAYNQSMESDYSDEVSYTSTTSTPSTEFNFKTLRVSGLLPK